MVVLALFLYKANSFGQDLMTIMGTVTESEQILTEEGQVYDIVDNQKGDELSVYTGKRIQVKGRVIGEGDAQQIMVFEFSIIKKPVPKQKENTWED